MNEATPQPRYVEIIKDEFNSRVSANPRYSLRAFARDVKMSPAQLSSVFNGKKGISEVSARKIASALSMTSPDAQMFIDLVLSVDSKSKAARALASTKLRENAVESKMIALDSFRVISDWYHFAILELTMTSHFVSSVDYIKKKLSLSNTEVVDAIKRLERLELLEKKNGRWRQTEVNVAAVSNVPSSAIKRFHAQVLQKSLAAIQDQHIDSREINSLMISIDKKDVPKYKKIIRRFHDDINAMAESSKGQRTDVYCLASQFFSLTNQ